MIANYRSVPVRPGSMGKPIPGYRVLIQADLARYELPDLRHCTSARASRSTQR